MPYVILRWALSSKMLEYEVIWGHIDIWVVAG